MPLRLILPLVAVLAGLVWLLGLWLSSDPIAVCVRDGSGDPRRPERYAVALSDCLHQAVAAAATPAEAGEQVYDFLGAIDARDALAPLVISNWSTVPAALRPQAFKATLARLMPYLRQPMTATVHQTGSDDDGDYVLVSYRSQDRRQGTALRLYLAPSGYGYRITRAQFAPVN